MALNHVSYQQKDANLSTPDFVLEKLQPAWELTMDVFVFSFVLKYKLKLSILQRTNKSLQLLPMFVWISAMFFAIVVAHWPDPATAVTDAFFVD